MAVVNEGFIFKGLMRKVREICPFTSCMGTGGKDVCLNLLVSEKQNFSCTLS